MPVLWRRERCLLARVRKRARPRGAPYFFRRAGETMSDSAVQKLNDAIKGVLCASWWTLWHSTPEIRAKAPPRHSDFRDHTPPTLQEVAWLYEGIAVDGKWTNGLIQMWCVF